MLICWSDRVWYEEDARSDKILKGLFHFMYTASPLSYPQLTRINAALQDKTIRGKRYKLSDELMGFMGGRPQTL